MKPPKCRTCGVEEWRHVCGGLTKIHVAADFLPRLTDGQTLNIDGNPHQVVIDAVTKIPTGALIIVTEPKRCRGRPKIHADGAARVRVHRARKKAT